MLCRIDCRKDTADQLQAAVAGRLRTFLTQKGQEVLKKYQEGKEKSDSKQDESHVFVEQLMTLHDQYRTVVKEYFKDVVVFQKNFKLARVCVSECVRAHVPSCCTRCGVVPASRFLPPLVALACD